MASPPPVLAPKPLDGGWGWMVVVGAHVSIGFAYSTPKVISIFFKEIQNELQASNSDVAWIASLMLASMYGGGPVCSALVYKYGSRPAIIAGGLMCGLGMVTASFGTSIIYLYICIGIIVGCGLALNLNASLTIISKYFLERRPLANGLAMAGSPVFLCFLAPLNQYLLIQFGWRGSLQILGALMLNCCVAGALMRPVAPFDASSVTPEKKVEGQPNNSTARQKRIDWKKAKAFLDVTFFKDRGFVIYLIGNIFFIFGAYAPIMFLPAYAIQNNVDEYAAAYLLSIMGFVDMFIRPGTGLIANTKWIRPRVQYFFSFAMIFNGLCHLLCPLLTNYTLLVIYAAFFGVTFGMVFALIFECLMDLMGSERFSSAVGLVTIIECFPMLLGPPAAAFLVDKLKDYQYLFFMCGGVIMTGGLFLFVMNIYNYHMLRKAESKKETQGSTNQVTPPKLELKKTPSFVPEEKTVPENKDHNGLNGKPEGPENSEGPH